MLTFFDLSPRTLSSSCALVGVFSCARQDGRCGQNCARTLCIWTALHPCAFDNGVLARRTCGGNIQNTGHWRCKNASPGELVVALGPLASVRLFPWARFHGQYQKYWRFHQNQKIIQFCTRFDQNYPLSPHCHNISQVQSYQALLEIFPMPIFTACLNLKSTSRTVFPSSIKCEVIIILPNNFDFIHHHCMSNILVILSKYHITKFFAVILF